MLHYTAFPTYLKSVRHFYFDTHTYGNFIKIIANLHINFE